MLESEPFALHGLVCRGAVTEPNIHQYLYARDSLGLEVDPQLVVLLAVDGPQTGSNPSRQVGNRPNCRNIAIALIDVCGVLSAMACLQQLPFSCCKQPLRIAQVRAQRQNQIYLCEGAGGLQRDLLACTATPFINTTILKGVDMQSLQPGGSGGSKEIR